MMTSTCWFHFKLSCKVTPRSFTDFTISMVFPLMCKFTYMVGCFLKEILICISEFGKSVPQSSSPPNFMKMCAPDDKHYSMNINRSNVLPDL